MPAILVVVALMMGPFNPSLLTVPVQKMPDEKDLWIEQLAQCESSASSTIRILDTNGKYSHGLLMFQMKTWIDFGKKFGTTKENIYDPDIQRTVARDMLDNGGQGHWWNCSRRIGPYPVDNELLMKNR